MSDALVKVGLNEWTRLMWACKDSPDERVRQAWEQAVQSAEVPPQPTMVYCVWCHKTHAAMPGETSCGVEGTWIVESTGLRWRS